MAKPKPKSQKTNNGSDPVKNDNKLNEKELCVVINNGYKVVGGVLVIVVAAVLVFSMLFEVLPLAIFKTLYLSIEGVLGVIGFMFYQLIVP